MKKEYLYLLGGVAAGYASNMLFTAKGNISDTEAKDFVNKWIKTVNANNLIGYGVVGLTQEQVSKATGAVTNLYCKDAVLVSTVGDVIYTGIPEITGYFDSFLSSEPQGTLNSISVQNFGDVVVANGNYTFILFDIDEGESEVYARFTYVLKRASNGVIKIQTHHSSAQPE
tara:strand:- start:304 stop:816 length:513 start_codon:yes stop_codon:yes gene_type:complete